LQILLADARVEFLYEQIDLTVVDAIATRARGELVKAPNL
jgi:hypothetical protein